jgi:hypothetical protein
MKRKLPIRRNSEEITNTTNIQSKKFQRGTSTIDRVALAECKSYINSSDKPRKQGGGRGNIGDINDIQKPEKYIKEG